MILSKIIAATMICAFSLAFSQSQDWVSVGKSSSNFEFLVKDFSKTNRPDIYSGWVKTVYAPKNIKNKKGVIISQRSKYSLSNWEINCNEKEYNIKNSIDYNSNGKVTGSYDNFLGWSKIAPDSMAEGVYQEVCYLFFN
ncbi:surface-adhesin E family protein [Chryseobacterium sp. 22532]|uniref:surface-adhesin E family protein n=1 Tax=Chryseobacterium sp. 22532 TaxID=3453938 RepID=UPI003F8333A6